jgi:ABC-2 type transport system ATP-binding protein
MVIQTFDLSKYYGSSLAILDLNLTIEHGEIFGFLGPNGAGKTTTIRLLLGLLKPSDGKIQLFGKNITTHLNECLKDIGYLPGDIGLYKDLTGIQYLTHFMKLRKKQMDENGYNRIEQLMNAFSIKNFACPTIRKSIKL